MNNKILIIGATGSQGGSTIKALLKKGANIKALVRNESSDKSKALKEQGVEVSQGDMLSSASLLKAMEGIHTVFTITTPFELGVDKETEQGLTIVKAAQDAGVKHFVYSSVSDADKNTGIPHFDSKYKVEEAVVASGLNYTIVAPVFFMDNLIGPWFFPSIQGGNIALAMPGDRALQYISVKNIGEITASIITRGEEFYGKRINIAGDELTGEEAAKTLSNILGQEIGYQGFPASALKEQNEDFGIMFEWFDKVGYSAKIDKLKSEFSDVQIQSFADWAKAIDWKSLMQAVPAEG